MGSNLISVVIPVYNVNQYLEECVKSIRNQAYENLEIIIVDDGSSDNSGVLCDGLAQHDSRINVVHQKNQGLPEARNSGLRIANGEYIIFIDSDDWIDSEMISDLYDTIKGSGSDIAVCNLVTFNRGGENVTHNAKYENEIIDYSDGASLKFYYSSLDACCIHMFKRSLLVDNDIWFASKDIVAQEDFYFQVRAYTHADRIATIDGKYYHYRERASSISRKGQEPGFAQKCLRFVHLTKEYIEQHSNRSCSTLVSYTYIDMMMASINNVANNTIEEITGVIRLFRNDCLFEDVQKTDVYKELYPDQTMQHKYYRLIVRAILDGYTLLPAMFEKMRISRLRSQTRNADLFP